MREKPRGQSLLEVKDKGGGKIRPSSGGANGKYKVAYSSERNPKTVKTRGKNELLQPRFVREKNQCGKGGVLTSKGDEGEGLEA